MATKQQPKQVRGRPFAKKGDPASDAARAAASTALAVADVEATPEAFAVFAQGLLRDPKVQAAFRRRFRRGLVTAQELSMLVRAAGTAPPPEQTDKQQQAREEVERTGRLSRGERQMFARLIRRRLGEEGPVEVPGYAWRLVRSPGSVAGVRPPRFSYERDEPEEPELSDALPLAEASRRLALAPPRDEAREIDADLIVTPEQALAWPAVARDAHDADDQQHRAACRACRIAWGDRP